MTAHTRYAPRGDL